MFPHAVRDYEFLPTISMCFHLLFFFFGFSLCLLFFLLILLLSFCGANADVLWLSSMTTLIVCTRRCQFYAVVEGICWNWLVVWARPSPGLARLLYTIQRYLPNGTCKKKIKQKKKRPQTRPS